MATLYQVCPVQACITYYTFFSPSTMLEYPTVPVIQGSKNAPIGRSLLLPGNHKPPDQMMPISAIRCHHWNVSAMQIQGRTTVIHLIALDCRESWVETKQNKIFIFMTCRKISRLMYHCTILVREDRANSTYTIRLVAAVWGTAIYITSTSTNLLIFWTPHRLTLLFAIAMYSLYRTLWLAPCDMYIGYCDYFPNSQSQFQYCSFIALWLLVNELMLHCFATTPT